MKHILSPLIILFAILTFPGTTAAADGGFSFTHENEVIEVSKATVDSWRGVTRLPKTSLLEPKPLPPVRTQVLRSVGSTVPEYQETVVYAFQPNKIYKSLQQLTAAITTEPVEPKLVIQQGKVTEFIPPQDGVSVHERETAFAAIAALTQSTTSTPLIVSIRKPVTDLAQTNSLGIRELLARGESTFHGSPRNRRTNIRVGVEKMKGIIIQPGEEFSFNEHLGPVEAEYGFVPELVIKRSGTVPELGGGLCQVSSTTFRAAMRAGLPITQRKNHSYAVQYYAPQGTDATIYPGVIDLKFMNDTPGAILVWPHFKDDNTLYFDFYGTKDSRAVALDKPYQYDRKSDGSMKATWRRVVTKNGEDKEDVFQSVYLPPALFHKEEEFVAAAPPSTTPSTPSITLPAVQTN